MRSPVLNERQRRFRVVGPHRLRTFAQYWYSSPPIPLPTGPQGKIFTGRREAGALV